MAKNQIWNVPPCLIRDVYRRLRVEERDGGGGYVGRETSGQRFRPI